MTEWLRSRCHDDATDVRFLVGYRIFKYVFFNKYFFKR